MRRHIGIFTLLAAGTGGIVLSSYTVNNTTNNTGGPLSKGDSGVQDAISALDGGDSGSDDIADGSSFGDGSVADASMVDGTIVDGAVADGANGDATADGPSGDGSVTDAGLADAADASDAMPPISYLMFAHLSPDAPPLDLCIQYAGMTWAGQTPVGYRGLGASGDAGPAALSFPQVSPQYVYAGAYTVRLVLAGSPDCSMGLALDVSITLGANTMTTIAAVGDLSPAGSDPAIHLAVFSDEDYLKNGDVNLRFINAAPSLASVDFGTGSLSDGSFHPLFAGVALGGVASGAGGSGIVDAHGYLDIGGNSGETMSAHASGGGADAVKASNVQFGASPTDIVGQSLCSPPPCVPINYLSPVTFALINGKSGGVAPRILECEDDLRDSTGTVVQCSVISQ